MSSKLVEPPTEELQRKKYVILTVVGVMFIMGFTSVLNRNELIRLRSDIWARWYASRQYLDTGRSIYDDRNGVEAAAMVPLPPTPLEAGYFYPAYLLIVTLPLALLPYPAAHFLWTAVGLSLYYFSIAMCVRSSGWPSSPNRVTLFFILATLFLPVIQHTIWSQFDMLVAISLSLSYFLLRASRPLAAGIALSGLAFKPQDALLAIPIFLLTTWRGRKSRSFVTGFFLGIASLLVFAQILLPGWVSQFLSALAAYMLLPNTNEAGAAILGQSLDMVSVAILGVIFILNWVRHSSAAPDSPTFQLLLVASLGLWWWSFPTIGMLHLVIAPLSLVFLVSAIRFAAPDLAKFAQVGALAILFLGWAGFVYGLIGPFPSGWHIKLSELVYKSLFPLFLFGISILGLSRIDRKSLNVQR